jgi:hypothetical protein
MCHDLGARHDLRGMPPSLDDAATKAQYPGMSAQRVSSALLGRGGGIAGTVDGTVVVMATLVAASATHNKWELVAVVGGTALVIWVSHVYARWIGESIGHNRRLDWPEFRGVIGGQLPILAAAVVPLVVLSLGAAGLLQESGAIWLALAAGWLTLGIEGARYARVERLGWAGSFAIIAVNLTLGAMVVTLKVLLD